MTTRTLELVTIASPEATGGPERDIVVLDPFWAPAADVAPGAVSVRQVVEGVLQRIDLATVALERLDDWATAARLPDRLVADGHSWWFRVRMAVRWDLQEMLLWRHVLGAVAPPGHYETISVPGSQPALVDAARALARRSDGLRVTVAGARAPVAQAGSREAARVAALPRPLRRAALWSWAAALGVRRGRAPLPPALQQLLDAPPRVLAVAWAGAFQVVEVDGQRRLTDPYLSLVLDRLAAQGIATATVVVSGEERQAIATPTAGSIPLAAIRRQWFRPEDATLESGAIDAALGADPFGPLDVDGCDLGPALAARVRAYAGAWLETHRRPVGWIERFLGDVRPGALFLDREGTRTAWIIAAQRLGVPVVAIQHGMIYPTNPEYVHPTHAAAPRPDVTCVFGVYERDILVERGSYPAQRVVVTGSPRSNPALESREGSPREREAVRRELGVPPGARLLVVSVAHGTIGDFTGAALIEQLLGGPLPGVHVTVKLHPQDQRTGRYRELAEGLARARGDDPPSLTTVRDVDVYRLLRAADAHLGQYSTMITDAIFAGTPTMVAVTHAGPDPLGYVASGVAVPVASIDDVRAFMADPRPPARGARERFLARHFEPGDAVGRVAATVAAAASGPPPS